MSKHIPPSVPHDKVMMELLKNDPEFAAEYLKAALDEADTDEDGQAIFLDAIRRVAKVQGIEKIANAAGIPRESLSRALSSKGNPRLNTLFAVMKAMGMHLSIEPIHPDHHAA